MYKIKISDAFRARLSEKLMDLGNFIAIGMVIGQFVSGKAFSTEQFLAGIFLTILCYIIGFVISN